MKTYTIKKGKHSSFPYTPQITRDATVFFSFKFNESARYAVNDDDDKDINKLFGISDSCSYHKHNSARIGWRYNPSHDKIDLFTYSYACKKREYKELTSIEIGKEYNGYILIMNICYTFYVAGEVSASIRDSKRSTKGLKYLLFPYFGGDKTAPHDIQIELEYHTW